MNPKSEYDQAAEAFLSKTGTAMECDYLGHFKYFEDDTYARAVWEITLTRPGRPPSVFRYGQSLQDSYDVCHCDGRIPIRPWPPAFRFRGETVSSGPYDISQRRREPSAYDVLSCCSAELLCEPDFYKWCEDWGMSPDSRKALAMHERCLLQSKQLLRTFPEPDVQDALLAIG